jgi:tetratricopeptide (TPR) repeat protein
MLKSNPKSAEALLMKGRMLMASGKKDQGLAELQKALAGDRNSADAHYFLGLAYLQSNQLPKAESEFYEALKINDKFGYAETGLAQIKMAQQNSGAAIQHAQAALKLDPNQNDTKLLLATAYIDQKDFNKAIPILEDFAKQNPGNAAAKQLLGIAYANQGNIARSEAFLNEAIRISPGNVESLATLVNIYMESNKSAQAFQRLNQELARNPQNPSLYELLGQAYAIQKNYAKAEEAYSRAITIDSNRHSAYRRLGQLYIKQGSMDKAKDRYEKILKLNPQDLQANVILGQMNQMNNPEKAKTYYKEALKTNPKFPLAANNLAWMLAETGKDLDEALRLAKLARESDPDSTDVADTLAWVYYKKGSYLAAIDILKQCIAKTPTNATYQHHLASCYLKNKEIAKAREAITKAVQLNPSLSSTEEAKTLLTKKK